MRQRLICVMHSRSCSHSPFSIVLLKRNLWRKVPKESFFTFSVSTVPTILHHFMLLISLFPVLVLVVGVFVPVVGPVHHVEDGEAEGEDEAADL